ncbi:MAG: hypothetical protein LBC40_03445, partial [Dysgonamonadaceae bacterium]|nr:hypothetical protein [Dysgonamonadaceae bacterium]
MKRNYLMLAFLLLFTEMLTALNVNTLDVEMNKVVQKKSQELNKEMNLSKQQKKAIMEVQTLYFENMIKAVKEAPNPLIINEKRNSEGAKLNNSIRSILNEAQ